MQRLIVDTDPGVDDAHALGMAIRATRAELVAVTTVAGNVEVDKTTANALFILAEAGADVPVYAGAAAALAEPFRGAPDIHGADGLGLVSRPRPVVTARPGDAADQIVNLAKAHPNALTLVALGPLTNLALALQRAPDIAHLFRRTIVMGGAIHGKGNCTPFAEFNIAADPEAAEMVLRAWTGLVLVPWETILDCAASRAEAVAMTAGSGPVARLIARINLAHAENVGFADGPVGILFPDPAAMAVALDPACVAESAAHAIRVELSDPDRRGETVVDWHDEMCDRPRVEIVMRLHRDRALRLMKLDETEG